MKAGLVIQHAFSAEFDLNQRWILDSGVICHICNEKVLFTHYQPLAKLYWVTVKVFRQWDREA